MSALLGTLALAAGLVAAAVACAAWIVAARRPDQGSSGTATARTATWALFACAGLACGALEWALVTHDFSVQFVAENGGRDVPLYYTVTSLWSGLQGSLLLWLLILGGIAVVAMLRPPPEARALHPVAMAVLSGVGAFFFALALGGGNAFHTVSPVPADGPGPNPLLQDNPAMGVHPPLLYLGYVGLTVPFAYAVAALVAGRADATAARAWTSAARRWVVVPWLALTAGIVLGAWWSYAVLGWGGYWAWDPVENASLLPWLTATALVHSLLLPRRSGLPLWTLSLAAATFVLVLIGTFLTRSGVVQSVHAFSASRLGPMLLGFLVAVLVGWVGLLVWRADRFGARAGAAAPTSSLWSRRTVFATNNAVLCAIAFTVLLGTLFPLLQEAATGDQVSVGPPYFSRMVGPLAFLLLGLMAVGPLVSAEGDDAAAVGRRSFVPFVVAAGLVGMLGVLGVDKLGVLFASGAAAFVIVSLVAHATPALGRPASVPWPLRRRRRSVGALLAHAGVALAAVAVTVSSAYATSAEQVLHEGQSIDVAGVSATLTGVHRNATSTRMSATADLAVGSSGQGTPLHPRLTFFPARSMTVASPAISSEPSRDVYLTLLQVDPDQHTATVRLAVNPLVGLLWASGGLIVAGGALAAWPRRRHRRSGPAVSDGDADLASRDDAGSATPAAREEVPT